jgi:hypothetical protein
LAGKSVWGAVQGRGRLRGRRSRRSLRRRVPRCPHRRATRTAPRTAMAQRALRHEPGVVLRRLGRRPRRPGAHDNEDQTQPRGRPRPGLVRGSRRIRRDSDDRARRVRVQRRPGDRPVEAEQSYQGVPPPPSRRRAPPVPTARSPTLHGHRMLDAGVPIVVVSRREHQRVSTTLDKYAHAVPGGDACASATLHAKLARQRPGVVGPFAPLTPAPAV